MCVLLAYNTAIVLQPNRRMDIYISLSEIEAFFTNPASGTKEQLGIISTKPRRRNITLFEKQVVIHHHKNEVFGPVIEKVYPFFSMVLEKDISIS